MKALLPSNISKLGHLTGNYQCQRMQASFLRRVPRQWSTHHLMRMLTCDSRRQIRVKSMRSTWYRRETSHSRRRWARSIEQKFPKPFKLKMLRTIRRLVLSWRRVHLSSSNLLAAIKCLCRRRPLTRTGHRQIQSKPCTRLLARRKPTSEPATQANQTQVHQRNLRTRLSVCTPRSTCITFNWCKMAKVLATKLQITTIRSSRNSCKK